MRIKKGFIYCLLILITLNANAQDSLNYSVQHNQVVALKNPLISTGNPAAIAINDFIEQGEIEFGYSSRLGNYKPSMLGNINSLFLYTDKYFILKKSIFKGSFNYIREYKENSNYSNVDNPYRLTPYLFVDFVGGDKITKEQYVLNVKWALNLSERISFGTALNYNASLAAQNRDPRAENKVSKLVIKPGVIINGDSFKWGADLTYTYFNEEINIGTVKADTLHKLYALKGLGEFNTHKASSFKRLYKHHKWGGTLYVSGKNNIISIGGERLIETADDGRKEGEATWIAKKNDSQLYNQTYHIKDKYNLRKGMNLHQFEASALFSQLIGTEILQEYERINDFNSNNWRTYGKEDKYESNIYILSIAYSFIKLLHENKINYKLSINSKYKYQTENYYVPDSHLKLTNIIFNIDFKKVFYWDKKQLQTNVSLFYKSNLDKNIQLARDNVITQKIIYPDFQYNSSNHWGSTIQLKYIVQPSFYKNSIFINTFYSLMNATSGEYKGYDRSNFNLSFGVLF